MIRNMKTLLRLMGGAALTTVAASSVVACGTQKDVPQLDGKYATLLGWYDTDNKTSKIKQEFDYDKEKKSRLFSLYVLFLNFIT